MTRPTGILAGAAAGAAGATALNAATYADMAARGRPASSAPEGLVEALVRRLGGDVPGDGETRDNRLTGLGALSGIAVGVAVGAVAGGVHRLVRRRGWTLPAPVAVVAIGAAAMALSDVPLKLLGVSDPTEWAASDWAADALPHLVFGLATYAALRGHDES